MNDTCCICCEETPQLVYQPCMVKTHRICKKCMKKTIQSMPISEENPKLKCQYPFEKCTSNRAYSDELISKFLKERFFIYKTASDKYSFQDFYMQKCKNCDKNCYIRKESVDIMYDFTYTCGYCYSASCYTCNRTPNAIGVCTTCHEYNYYNNPSNYNYFFFKPKTKRYYLTDYKCKNEDLDAKSIVNFISKKFADENIYTVCPVCETKIEKTEDCNSVAHCHVEICNACGMFSDIGECLDDHWSARGLNGCPRWDTDTCITKNVKNFVCQERVCYGHTIGDCKKKEHALGVKEYKDYKKKRLMYHYIINVPKSIRGEVIECIPKSIAKYLPSSKEIEVFDLKSFDALEYKNF